MTPIPWSLQAEGSLPLPQGPRAVAQRGFEAFSPFGLVSVVLQFSQLPTSPPPVRQLQREIHIRKNTKKSLNRENTVPEVGLEPGSTP